MSDLYSLLVVAGFALVIWALVRLCDRLMRS
jgi:hypothetical protein